MQDRPDPIAYGPLLDRLRRRARRLVDDPETAADLAQETLLRLWRHQQGDGAPAEPAAYAMTILRNLAASHWRMQRPTDRLEEDTASVPAEVHRTLALRDLAAAVARLPPAQAELIAMVAAGMTSPAELARRTGLPPGTVMSRLARARAALRRDLALDHGSADLLEEG